MFDVIFQMMKGPILVICIHTNETYTMTAHNTVQELIDTIHCESFGFIKLIQVNQNNL